MSADYWLGVATPFVVVVAFYTLAEIYRWVAWWFQDTNLGRGVGHEIDRYIPEDERWYPRSLHYHRWPPGTPWWLAFRLEPLRIWLCLRHPERRPATPKERLISPETRRDGETA